jgi:tripartite-type tricarboxylate transporter receptor subunit TctC
MRLDEMRIFLAILLCAASAHAQEYPAKPIRFIVAAAPDGYTLAQIQVGTWRSTRSS